MDPWFVPSSASLHFRAEKSKSDSRGIPLTFRDERIAGTARRFLRGASAAQIPRAMTNMAGQSMGSGSGSGWAKRRSLTNFPSRAATQKSTSSHTRTYLGSDRERQYSSSQLDVTLVSVIQGSEGHGGVGRAIGVLEVGRSFQWQNALSFFCLLLLLLLSRSTGPLSRTSKRQRGSGRKQTRRIRGRGGMYLLCR